jgi:hypothetical protein
VNEIRLHRNNERLNEGSAYGGRFVVFCCKLEGNCCYFLRIQFDVTRQLCGVRTRTIYPAQSLSLRERGPNIRKTPKKLVLHCREFLSHSPNCHKAAGATVSKFLLRFVAQRLNKIACVSGIFVFQTLFFVLCGAHATLC